MGDRAPAYSRYRLQGGPPVILVPGTAHAHGRYFVQVLRKCRPVVSPKSHTDGDGHDVHAMHHVRGQVLRASSSADFRFCI